MRTPDQNALFHVWVREIGNHIRAGGVSMTNATVKDLLKAKLGNRQQFFDTSVPMSTTMYQRADEDLSPWEHQNEIISFEAFLTKIQVWAATDLNLELSSIVEPHS